MDVTIPQCTLFKRKNCHKNVLIAVTHQNFISFLISFAKKEISFMGGGVSSQPLALRGFDRW